MEELQCGKCCSTESFLRKKGAAVGLYCSGCGKWYKWVGKKDINFYKHKGFKVHEESYIPESQKEPTFASQTLTSSQSKIGVAFEGLSPSDDEFYMNLLEEDENTEEEVVLPVKHSGNKGSDTCLVCASGTMDTIAKSDSIGINFFDKVMFVRTKDDSELLGSFKVSYCPSCGKKL